MRLLDPWLIVALVLTGLLPVLIRFVIRKCKALRGDGEDDLTVDNADVSPPAGSDADRQPLQRDSKVVTAAPGSAQDEARLP